MGIKNYQATKDNTISNTYRPYSDTRRTSNVNFGLTDNLEIYSLYGSVTASVSENEKSRVLMQFNTSQIATDRTNGDIPASGSVSFFLNVKNFPETSTSPAPFTLVVTPLSQSWSEGRGKSFDDMSNEIGSNWETASSLPTVLWDTAGGDVRTTSLFKQTLLTGTGDLNLDVTSYVEGVITDGLDDYGVLIQLTGSQETASQSYYKTNWYSLQYRDYHKRPVLQARFNDSTQDNGGNFYLSSSRAQPSDNLNTIYLYNYIRGNLVNIPSVGTGDIFVSVFSGTATTPGGSKLASPAGGGVVSAGNLNITGSYVSTGVYSASFAFNSSSLDNIYAVWHDDSTQFFTGSVIEPVERLFVNARRTNKYYLSITNLKKEYLQSQSSRLRLFTRNPSLSPVVQTTAIAEMKPTIVEKAYYQVVRKRDNLKIIPYGTGSDTDEYTRLSYDQRGNYLDLDFGNFDAGTTYTISFVFYEDGQYREQSQQFDFGVI